MLIHHSVGLCQHLLGKSLQNYKSLQITPALLSRIWRTDVLLVRSEGALLLKTKSAHSPAAAVRAFGYLVLQMEGRKDGILVWDTASHWAGLKAVHAIASAAKAAGAVLLEWAEQLLPQGQQTPGSCVPVLISHQGTVFTIFVRPVVPSGFCQHYLKFTYLPKNPTTFIKSLLVAEN